MTTLTLSPATPPTALHVIAGLTKPSQEPTPYTNGKWFRLVRLGLNTGQYVVIETRPNGKTITHRNEGSLLAASQGLESDARVARKTGNQHLLNIAIRRAEELKSAVERLKAINPEYS